ncbi:MAG: alpha/beta hydrolase [Treponema sp.]|nr:alpha/beta hydrolase [Spirochaetales bacterium]MDY4831778.1 alpha/beta hydrolase [Treponema sp.]MDY5917778.1 alpha/beta hydrolase [Treponema sp.]MDY6189505.1 alpha/beta hydrolase [Treponema sp.]
MNIIKRINCFILILFFLSLQILFAQDAAIYLWKDVKGMKNEPSVMFMHKAKNPDGFNQKTPCVIICPGGSYHHLGLYNEGFCSAKWFSENGITAFMLKYRTNESFYNHPTMLEDIQRAIQIVRENAQEFGIDENKLGVIGYSAGGHLVTMAGEFFESHNELKKLGIDSNISLRPDFVVPVYPVVSMQDDIAHQWSRKSLLGKNQSQARKDEFSMELNVPENMPPTYIVVAKDDPVVDYHNSLRLYDSLVEKNIPDCKLTVYEWGKHGFGMVDNDFMKTFHWNESLKEWLKEISIIE